MPSPPGTTIRKTIPELIARYRLEPAIRDFFVEGRSDAAVIKRFLRTRDWRGVAVYEISTVDIPPGAVLSSNLPDGARGRVVYLAIEFNKQLPSESKAATCCADRDYDAILGRSQQSPFLALLDYSCIETYAYNADTLRNLMASVAPPLEETAGEIIEEMRPLLQSLFAIRATNISLGLNLSWLQSFAESCTLSGGSIEFDENDFIQRYLSKNSRLSERQNFVVELGRLKLQVKGELRLFIRGHDFIEALAWYLRKRTSKSSSFYRPEVLEQLVLAHLDHDRLANEQFFVRLASRVA